MRKRLASLGPSLGVTLALIPMAALAQDAVLPLSDLGPRLTSPVGMSAGEGSVSPHDPVVLLDRQRLYEGSAMGQALLEQLDAESLALIAENRNLEAALELEEQDLTKRRATLSAAEFRALADDFDRRVEELRQSQDSKSRALARSREEERQHFFTASVPVLAQMMQEIGAVAILDHAAVILSFDRIDITQAAITRLDAAFAAGEISTKLQGDLAPSAPSATEPPPSAPAVPGPRPSEPPSSSVSPPAEPPSSAPASADPTRPDPMRPAAGASEPLSPPQGGDRPPTPAAP